MDHTTGANDPPISEEDGMPFEPGHRKVGGRTAGTRNRLNEDASEVARRLLGDADYERSLRERLIRGEAPRMELHLWELAFGKPRVEPSEAPEGSGAIENLAQLLEKLGGPKTENYSSNNSSASPGTDQRDNEEEPT